MLKIQLQSYLSKAFCIFLIFFFILVLIFSLNTKVFLTSISPIIIINLIIININIFFWVWVLISKSSLKKILVISYFSSVIALYSSDFLIGKKNEIAYFKYFLEQNPNYDTRSKFEIYSDLKKTEAISPLYYPYNQLIKKRKFFANINGTQKEILILSGVSNRKTIVCNETGKYLIYMSDRYGFNNPNPTWDTVSDAVVLGDSMVLGECVSQGKDISSLLRNKENKVITNLGMGGNGPLLNLATLKEYQPLTKSNKIIWVYYEGNDLLDLYNEKKNEILLNYFDSNFIQALHDKQNLLDKKILEIIDEEYKEYQNTRIISLLLLRNIRNTIKDFFKNNKKKLINAKFYRNKNIPFVYQKLVNVNSETPYLDNVRLYEKILKEVWKFSQTNNIDNYFVYLPSVARFNGEFIDSDTLFGRNEILKLVKKYDFDLIDTYDEYFKNQTEPLKYYPYNGKRRHFNSKGYEVISNIISDRIYKKN
jgi:hypothetical protein